MARKKNAGKSSLQANLTAVETVTPVGRNTVGCDNVTIPGRKDTAMGVDTVTFHGAGTGRPKVA